MWHLLSIVLWFRCVQSYYQPPTGPTNNPYGPSYYGNGMASNQNPQGYPFMSPSAYKRPGFGEQTAVTLPFLPGERPAYWLPKDPRSPFYNYPNNGAEPVGYYLRSDNLRETQPSQRSDVYQTADLFDLDYGSLNDGGDNGFPEPIPLIASRNTLDTTSYYEELELTEKFGNYLKRRTRLDASSTATNDAAHQYNALLAVIIALAKLVRNSCTEFDQTYDQIYLPTVETYYKFGLANGEKVAVMIEDYIRKGNSHMPKIIKLKEDICDNELFCATAFDSHINNSPLVYVKELETLEALAQLARSFYPYIEEFNQAAQKGTVLEYLQKSKDKLRGYIMHAVNSVEHLTDRTVKCT